jgi:peptide/nickel transport system substrate-binding protein
MRNKAVSVVVAAVFCGTSLGTAGVGATSAYAATGRSDPAIFTTIDEDHPITLGSPMNPFNAKGNSFDSYDQIELGYSAYDPLDPNADLPAIASSWQQVPGGLVVHIQPKAGWSDGDAVTSADVKTSTAIAFAVGTQPPNLAGVTVLGPKTIRFNEQPGTTNDLFASQVLQTIVVPATEYDAELPADIWTVIAASQGKGASASTAKSTLQKIAKTIEDFAPSTDIAAGPFYIERLNAGEALLVKNSYFFDASAISPQEVLLRNYTGNEEIWTYLEGGELDAAPYTAMPTNVLKQVLSVSGNVEKIAPSFVAASVAFNEDQYPYGMLPVRQALAYVWNRSDITKVGEPVSGQAPAYQTGLVGSVASAWLSKSELSSLNPYNYDPAKATSLLEGAGFTKKGGQWYMPDGKPWKMTINVPSGFSDWIEAASYMAHEMTSFGVPATMATAPDYPTYLTNIANGDYAVGFWLNALGPAVYNAYRRVWGNDVTGVGNTPAPSTKPSFLHTPATYSLPSYGTINVNSLTDGLAGLSSAQAKPAVAKLAAAYDQELPMITIWDYVLVQFVNTKRFTDFPSSSALLNNPPGVWMWNGYVHAG